MDIKELTKSTKLSDDRDVYNEYYLNIHEELEKLNKEDEINDIFRFLYDENTFNKKPNDKDIHKEICSELHETYVKKNNDYGNSFKKSYDEFGIVSAVVRMTDKMERIKSLTGGTKSEVTDESIEDTILDLANYAIMTAIELRNRRY